MVLDESLSGLDDLKSHVETIYKRSKLLLTEDDSIFLEHVRQALPDILTFTGQQFNHILLRGA